MWPFAPLLVIMGLAWMHARAHPQRAAFYFLLGFLWVLAFGLLYFAWRRRGRTRPFHGFGAALFLTGWGIMGMVEVAPWAAWRQVWWLLLSAVVLYGVALWLERARPSGPTSRDILTGFGFTTLLVALTLVIGQYPGGQGARLWLGCCGIYLQPAAWHKVTLVAYTAWGLTRASVPPWWLVGLVLTGLLFAGQGDLGTLALFFVITFGMLALAPRWRRRVLAGVALVFLGALWWAPHLPRVQQRFLAWMMPEADPWGAGYQILQALQAINRGGWFGVGPKGLEGVHRVPLAYTDVYYALVAETWGWFGGFVLLAGLSVVFHWALQRAYHEGFRLSGVIAWGFTWWWMVQTFFVIGGNLRLLPLTGMPIPFVAYGGSELTAAYMGLGWLAFSPSLNDWSSAQGQEVGPGRSWRLVIKGTKGLWTIGVVVLLAAHTTWLLLDVRLLP